VGDHSGGGIEVPFRTGDPCVDDLVMPGAEQFVVQSQRGERRHIVARPCLPRIGIKMQRGRDAEGGSEFVGLRMKCRDFGGRSFVWWDCGEEAAEEAVFPAEIEDPVAHLRIGHEWCECLGCIHPIEDPSGLGERLPFQRVVVALQCDIHPREAVQGMAEEPALRKDALHVRALAGTQAAADVAKLGDRVVGQSARPRCTVGNGIEADVHPRRQRDERDGEGSREYSHRAGEHFRAVPFSRERIGFRSERGDDLEPGA